MKIKINYEHRNLKHVDKLWLIHLKEIEKKQGYINVKHDPDSYLRYKETETMNFYLLMKEWCIEVD